MCFCYIRQGADDEYQHEKRGCHASVEVLSEVEDGVFVQSSDSIIGQAVLFVP